MIANFTSLLKRLINSRFRSIDDHIFFLHIPKCGGTSISNAISRYYPFSKVNIGAESSSNAAKAIYQLNNALENDYYYVLKLREKLLLYFMSEDIKFISGHCSFGDIGYQKFKNKYKYITVLRHPIKRWLSHYFFNRYKSSSNHCRIKEDLAEFVQTEHGKKLGHEYVKFLGELDEQGNYTSKESIERAKSNLHKFEIIGCLEFLDDFLKQFKDHFGVKLIIPKKNLNPKSESYIKSVITEDIEEKINKICEPDLEIYQYAIDKFVNRNFCTIYS